MDRDRRDLLVLLNLARDIITILNPDDNKITPERD